MNPLVQCSWGSCCVLRPE